LRACGFESGIACSWARSLSRPYERPRLSKDYLRGESDRDDAFVHEQGFGEEHRAINGSAAAGSSCAGSDLSELRA
jgi:3-phenylpropionate/trans-cinnamate dioxygenase ferredoxin reductase component